MPFQIMLLQHMSSKGLDLIDSCSFNLIYMCSPLVIIILNYNENFVNAKRLRHCTDVNST